MANYLTGALLKSVSRSFYLTIRILPAPLKEPIGLAYLLARTSDTIADFPDSPADDLLSCLESFRGMLHRQTLKGLAYIQRDVRPTNAGEIALMASLHAVLTAYDKLPKFDHEEIQKVADLIVRGQMQDLQRFRDRTRIAALPDAAALDEYTYLVAGCVGEFWTRICLHHLPSYSTLPAEELARLGKSYGQGLQLVNILRDLPADLNTGRCYLPADELRAAGVEPADVLKSAAAVRPVFDRWLARAREHLADGKRYVESLRPMRLRAGVFLPWHLGEETLALLQERYPLTHTERVKVTRSEVRGAMWKAARFALAKPA